MEKPITKVYNRDITALRQKKRAFFSNLYISDVTDNKTFR